jgi:adenylate kinase
MMLNIVLFGAPGSGKGTQSEKIAEAFGLAHISTGDVLRSEIAAGSHLGNLAKGYIDAGQLVPDGLIVDMLAGVLDARKETGGVIFDGFPRTLPQADALKKILGERGTDVTVMIDLQVDEQELVSRLLERGRRSGRSDDNQDTIQSRLAVYHRQTAPLAGYYRAAGKYCAVQGWGTIDEVFARIREALAAIDPRRG